MPINFIDKIAPLAIKHGQVNNILPSLIISQSCLESAYSTSILVVKANNLFGIKKGDNWSGKTFKKTTNEHRPDGSIYQIVAEFRSYPDFEGCILDLCEKYRLGLTWEPHNRYQAIIGETNYKKATQAVKDAGYASDTKYPEKLNSVIEKYDLTKYDKKVAPSMVKIALDAGHGFDTAGKRSPENEREWSFNNKVLIAATVKLNTYEDVQILRLDDPTGKTDVALKARTDKANAWKADVLVSIHHNALAGKWHSGGGIETFVQEKTASKASKDIAAIINPRIVKAMGLKDRGVKTSNLHMLRLSNSPAILTEGGFFDSTVDIKVLRDDSRLIAQGEAIAEGLAAHFKLKPKTQSKPTPSPPPTPTPPNQPITKPKETIRMFKTSSNALQQAVEQEFTQAVKDKIIDTKWLVQLQQGKLSLDDAFALKVLIDQRRKK